MARPPAAKSAARPARKRAARAAAQAPEAVPPPGVAGQGPEAFGHAIGEFMNSLGHLQLPVGALGQIQQDYVAKATELWNGAVERLPLGGDEAAAPAAARPIGDRRFSGEDWLKNPAATFTAQLYLLNARTLTQMAESLQGDEKTRARVRFAVQQFVDAASPSNYLALNPEVQRKALASHGESLTQGLQHLWSDIQQGHLSQTDETVFEVGRNVATTEGTVVFENEYLQLIEYAPLTDKVFARPILFVPPCINKYYILDLQPANSLIRHTVAEGHRTFVVSWRNPDESLQDRTWDDYIEHAVIRAIEVVQQITGAKTINTLGFCVGGTLLATALAVLAARGRQVAESATLLTTFLDFSDTGILDIFVDEASVQLREMTLGTQAPNGPRLLKGGELASTFSFLRPNDLVWNYVVGNYLKGETPPAFDLLYWNSDATNMPGPMYCWYLRNTYLENLLREPPCAGRSWTCRPSRRRPSSTARARTTSCRGRPPGRRRRSSADRPDSCWARPATSRASSTRPRPTSAASGPTTGPRQAPTPGWRAPPSIRAAGGPAGRSGWPASAAASGPRRARPAATATRRSSRRPAVT